jgi:gamma-glutamyl:cysteine ligase YbdK (ATP-grasp superfamily)
MFELAAERRVLDIVNRAVELSALVQYSHAAAMRAEMRMVVGAEEEVADAIFLGNNSAKATHRDSLSKRDFV